MVVAAAAVVVAAVVAAVAAADLYYCRPSIILHKYLYLSIISLYPLLSLFHIISC